jgi:hypothetical protein
MVAALFYGSARTKCFGWLRSEGLRTCIQRCPTALMCQQGAINYWTQPNAIRVSGLGGIGFITFPVMDAHSFGKGRHNSTLALRLALPPFCEDQAHLWGSDRLLRDFSAHASTAGSVGFSQGCPPAGIMSRRGRAAFRYS